VAAHSSSGGGGGDSSDGGTSKVAERPWASPGMQHAAKRPAQQQLPDTAAAGSKRRRCGAVDGAVTEPAAVLAAEEGQGAAAAAALGARAGLPLPLPVWSRLVSSLRIERRLTMPGALKQPPWQAGLPSSHALALQRGLFGAPRLVERPCPAGKMVGTFFPQANVPFTLVDGAGSGRCRQAHCAKVRGSRGSTLQTGYRAWAERTKLRHSACAQGWA
jgi:hypothetical protein